MAAESKDTVRQSVSSAADFGKPIFAVAAWNDVHENNRTRELKKLDWVPVPNKMDGAGYATLVTHDDGAAHFGAWVAILEIASRCRDRGVLVRGDGRPHDAASLSLISRLPVAVFRDAIPRLVDIGWLAIRNTPHDDATTSQDGAGIPQEDAETSQDDAPRVRARTCALREGDGMERKGTEPEGAAAPQPTPPPKPQAIAKTDPRVTAVRQMFSTAFETAIGEKYVVTNHAREASIAKSILTACDGAGIAIEALWARMARMHSPGSFWRGKDISVFLGHFNEFAADPIDRSTNGKPTRYTAEDPLVVAMRNVKTNPSPQLTTGEHE